MKWGPAAAYHIWTSSFPEACLIGYACMQVDLRQYINELMVSTGACASAGYPIASCKIYSDKSYAFLEFRSVEEASNCMAFDGVAFKDSYLRVHDLSSMHSLIRADAMWGFCSCRQSFSLAKPSAGFGVQRACNQMLT